MLAALAAADGTLSPERICSVRCSSRPLCHLRVPLIPPPVNVGHRSAAGGRGLRPAALMLPEAWPWISTGEGRTSKLALPWREDRGSNLAAKLSRGCQRALWKRRLAAGLWGGGMPVHPSAGRGLEGTHRGTGTLRWRSRAARGRMSRGSQRPTDRAEPSPPRILCPQHRVRGQSVRLPSRANSWWLLGGSGAQNPAQGGGPHPPARC